MMRASEDMFSGRLHYKGRSMCRPVPQRPEVERPAGRFGNLDDGAVTGSDYLGRHVDEAPPYTGGVGCCLADHVLAEGLKKGEGHERHVVEGRVRREAFKRKLLRCKVFQCAMNQFVGSPVVIKPDQRVGIEVGSESRRQERICKRRAPQNIGVNDRLRLCKRQQPLAPLYGFSHEYGCTSLVPRLSAVIQRTVVPGRALLLARTTFKRLPDLRGKGINPLAEVTVDLTAHEVADTEIFEVCHDLLVKEAGVHAKEDGNVPVATADEFDKVGCRRQNRCSVVTVLLAAAKDGIYDVFAPGYVQRLKALYAVLVRRLDALSHVRFRVVHDHRIDSEHNDVRLFHPEPPDKDVLDEAAKEPLPTHRTARKEALHLVRGDHVTCGRLDYARVARIAAQFIEVRHVAARTIGHEEEDLAKQAPDANTLPAFTHGGEENAHRTKEAGRCQVPAEERQTSPAREPLRCRVKIVDRSSWRRDILAFFSHLESQPFGWRIGLIA